MNRLQSDPRPVRSFAVCLSLFLVMMCPARAAMEPNSITHGLPTAGIAYDEIARFVPAGTPPPAIGSFQDDAKTIAALPPLVVPKQHQLDLTAVLLLAAIPGVGTQYLAKVAGVLEAHANMADLGKQKEKYANAKIARQRTGVLARFAYCRGWSRVELTPGAVRIDKPDQGVTLALDAATKTYTSVHTLPVGETFTATSAGARGAATLDGAPSVESLPAERIEGIAARGYRTSGSITIARASFTCAAGRHHVTETEFVADFPDPRYDAAQDADSTQPLVTACMLGNSASHREPGRFVLYRLVMVDDDTPTPFGIALERGNIHRLAEQEDGLFQPPAGYSEKP